MAAFFEETKQRLGTQQICIWWRFHLATCSVSSTSLSCSSQFVLRAFEWRSGLLGPGFLLCVFLCRIPLTLLEGVPGIKKITFARLLVVNPCGISSAQFHPLALVWASVMQEKAKEGLWMELKQRSEKGSRSRVCTYLCWNDLIGSYLDDLVCSS